MKNRFHPLVARRALRRLRQNPDDTAQAIVVIGAMAGNSGRRLYRRFRASPRGLRLLRDKPSLLAITGDLARLKAMPAGSIGAALADFYTSEQLSAQGLADASQMALAKSGPRPAQGDDEQWLGQRMRDLHDVFHVLTGYGRDLRGETAVLAFSAAQTRNTGIAYLVLEGLRRAGWRSEYGKLVRHAFRRGRRAAWLVDQDWESLLELPLARVRAELGISPPVAYEPLRSAGAPLLSA